MALRRAANQRCQRAKICGSVACPSRNAARVYRPKAKFHAIRIRATAVAHNAKRARHTGSEKQLPPASMVAHEGRAPRYATAGRHDARRRAEAASATRRVGSMAPPNHRDPTVQNAAHTQHRHVGTARKRCARARSGTPRVALLFSAKPKYEPAKVGVRVASASMWR